MVVVYGTGGAGKTTLVLDLAVHLAAGEPWLGLVTPPRPLRIVWIENEGPRPMFRLKLREKLAAWTGGSLARRIHIHEHPWGRFNFRDAACQEALVQHLRDAEADVLVVGPVAKIGMQGGGTADEITEFMQLVENVQAGAGGRVAVVLIHHENRAGQVSGAWEGFPDSLVHVQAQGHGRTRLYWQKTRWSSTLHGTATNLLWADGYSFTAEAREDVTEETIADGILAAVREIPGGSWSKIRAKVKGNATEAAAMRDRLLAAGQIVNTATRDGYFQLWAADDPAATRSEPGTGLERLPFPLPAGADDPSRSRSSPIRNGERNGTAEPGRLTREPGHPILLIDGRA